jgi:hypothetical protein
MPEILDISGGPVTITGNTAGAPDELEGAIDCGLTNNPLDGSQLYYATSMVAGTTYRLTLSSARSPTGLNRCAAGARPRPTRSLQQSSPVGPSYNGDLSE